MERTGISYKKFFYITGIWWSAWLILQALVLHILQWPWDIALVDSLVCNISLAGISLAIGNTLRFYRPDSNKSYHLILWSFILALLWSLGIDWVLSRIFPLEKLYIIFLDRSLLIRFFIAFLMIGCMLLISWLMHYLSAQRDQENRSRQSEKLSRDAELASLRQQLQPHFLFNSLNSISALTSQRPEEARRMIQQLSDFLRGTLKKDDRVSQPLNEELQHLQLYLDIEKVRFGHRLQTDIQYTEEAEKCMIPPLVLQPIVENAIKFGLYDTVGELTIRISAYKENSELYIKVQNPFDPQTTRPNKGTGFGLSSVQRRLSLLFGRNDLVQSQTDDNIYTTILIIPQ